MVIKARRLSRLIFTLIGFIIFVAILYGRDFSCTFCHYSHHLQPLLLPPPFLQSLSPSVDEESRNATYSAEKEKRREKTVAFAVGRTAEGCDIFSGKWVIDEERKPMYEERDCPYIQPQLTCQEHGRPDRDYQLWRWQPHACDLPKFNATLMLEALRGKRMLFIGDSLNRGQFVSMICLLHRLVPEGAKSMDSSYDAWTVFKFKNYNATIEFYWAPFLLESNADNAVVHRISDRIVRKASIKKHGKFWKGADIVVFNTYLWWMTGYKMKIL